MLYRRFFLVIALLLPVSGCTDPESSQADRATRIALSVTETALDQGDTLHLDASVYAGQGSKLTQLRVTWSSSNASIASVDQNGVVTGHTAGSVGITARFEKISATAIVQVIPPRGDLTCAMQGTNYQGIIGGGRWTRNQSPHFIGDSVTLRESLTIDAGALVCGTPRARLFITGAGKLIVNGTADRPVRFSAVDTVGGWNGIYGDQPTNGGSITLKHVDMKFVQHVSAGSVDVDSSSFYRTSLASGGNFAAGGFIRNSLIDNGDLYLSSGAFVNTVIRRGGFSAFYAKFGGTITIDGGRIEDSPSIAFQFGSPYDAFDPKLVVVKAPEITGSRGPILDVRLSAFKLLWPTTADESRLLNNPNRTIRLAAMDSSVDNLYLRSDFNWEIGRFFISSFSVKTLTLEPGTKLTGSSYFFIDRLIAPGTTDRPITLASINNCWGLSGCAFTVRNRELSQISNVRLENTELRFAN